MGRVDEEVRREIGAILQQKARDPRLQWVSVTRVEVSRDLSVAQVYVSTLGDEGAKEGVLEALVKAGPFVRSELGRSLRLRRTPELRFHYDRGIEHSLHVNQMLRDLGVTGSTDTPAGPATASTASEGAGRDDPDASAVGDQAGGGVANPPCDDIDAGDRNETEGSA